MGFGLCNPRLIDLRCGDVSSPILLPCGGGGCHYSQSELVDDACMVWYGMDWYEVWGKRGEFVSWDAGLGLGAGQGLVNVGIFCERGGYWVTGLGLRGLGGDWWGRSHEWVCKDGCWIWIGIGAWKRWRCRYWCILRYWESFTFETRSRSSEVKKWVNVHSDCFVKRYQNTVRRILHCRPLMNVLPSYFKLYLKLKTLYTVFHFKTINQSSTSTFNLYLRLHSHP